MSRRDECCSAPCTANRNSTRPGSPRRPAGPTTRRTERPATGLASMGGDKLVDFGGVLCLPDCPRWWEPDCDDAPAVQQTLFNSAGVPPPLEQSLGSAGPGPCRPLRVFFGGTG